VQDHASTQATADARFAELLTGVAIHACAAILAVDTRTAQTRRKADDSPVTAADMAAQAAIQRELARLAPGLPVVSEEAQGDWPDEIPRDFLLVDPLDGTAEFIAGRTEYTVNIALVRDGIPIAGVVAAPALGLLWRAAMGHGAERLRFFEGNISAPEMIRTRRWPEGERIAAVSRSHFDPASAAFLERIAPVKTIEAGSALKFCRVAEGAADVYPRLAPTSEWDIAAGHALVVAAGGAVVAPDGGKLRYGRVGERFRVPGFIAWCDGAAAPRFAL
jgi:3'(2'), 5'-bisphosphate nucleotidase